MVDNNIKLYQRFKEIDIAINELKDKVIISDAGDEVEHIYEKPKKRIKRILIVGISPILPSCYGVDTPRTWQSEDHNQRFFKPK